MCCVLMFLTGLSFHTLLFPLGLSRLGLAAGAEEALWLAAFGQAAVLSTFC